MTSHASTAVPRVPGFRTSTDFTASFRKQAGMTPGQFRKRRLPKE